MIKLNAKEKNKDKIREGTDRRETTKQLKSGLFTIIDGGLELACLSVILQDRAERSYLQMNLNTKSLRSHCRKAGFPAESLVGMLKLELWASEWEERRELD